MNAINTLRNSNKFQVTGISLTKTRPNAKRGLSAKPGRTIAKRPIFSLDAKIDSVPTFLRINSIMMATFLSSITQFVPLLQKFTYTDSVKFCAYTNIGLPRSNCFSHSTYFLSCLSDKVLPILDGYRPHFNFNVYSWDANDAMSSIGSILTFPQVQASSNVTLTFQTDNNQFRLISSVRQLIDTLKMVS